MASHPQVRAAVIDDAAAIARVHVAAWQQTYAELLPADYLRNLDVERRTSGWTRVLSGDSADTNDALYVAESDGNIVGFAHSRKGTDDPTTELTSIYLLDAHHGSGLGQALLDALGPGDMFLWVADPNPRASAFYRRNGFEFDGAVKVEHALFDLRTVRMVRRSPG